MAIYHSDTVTECAPAVFDDTGALANFDDAVGELVNTEGSGPFGGYYNDPAATAERMRHGMYWSGDLAYRDADGWIYLAGRTADWMRVDGENQAAAPIERMLQRLAPVTQVAVYAVPDERVGDQIMAALVLGDGLTLTPERTDELPCRTTRSVAEGVAQLRADQRALPQTATNKILKRELSVQGVTRRRRSAVGTARPRHQLRPCGAGYSQSRRLNITYSTTTSTTITAELTMNPATVLMPGYSTFWP